MQAWLRTTQPRLRSSCSVMGGWSHVSTLNNKIKEGRVFRAKKFSKRRDKDPLSNLPNQHHMWAFPDERNSYHFAVVTECWGPLIPAAKCIPNCYRWENRGTERSIRLPKVSSLIRSGGRIHAQTFEVQKPYPFPWSLTESERSEVFSSVSHEHVSVHLSSHEERGFIPFIRFSKAPQYE